MKFFRLYSNKVAYRAIRGSEIKELAIWHDKDDNNCEYACVIINSSLTGHLFKVYGDTKKESTAQCLEYLKSNFNIEDFQDANS